MGSETWHKLEIYKCYTIIHTILFQRGTLNIDRISLQIYYFATIIILYCFILAVKVKKENLFSKFVKKSCLYLMYPFETGLCE
jgi:hypothetical protein